MLRVVLSDRYDSVGVYISFRCPTPPTYADGTHIWDFRPGPAMDLLLAQFFALDVPIGWFSAYDLLRFKPPDGELYIKIGHIKPLATRHFEPTIDRGRWLSSLGSIIKPGPGLAIAQSSSWSNETDVRHPSARGELTMPLSLSRDIMYGREKVYLFADLNHTIYKLTGVTNNRYYRNITLARAGAVDTFSVSSLYTTFGPSGNRYDLRELVERLQTLPPLRLDRYDSNSPNTMWWSDFNLEMKDGLADGTYTEAILSYTFRNYARSVTMYTIPGTTDTFLPVSDRTYKVVVTLSINTELLSRLDFLDPGTYALGLLSVPKLTQSYTCVSGYDNFSIPYDNLYRVQDITFDHLSSTYVSPAHVRFKPGTAREALTELRRKEGNILSGYDHDEQVDKFHKFVATIHPDIRPMACLSSNDALETYSSSSNFLESVPELPMILKSIKDVGRIGKLIKNISAGNPGCIPEFVDLLADGYLAYTYGAKPLVSDIKESRRIASMYMDQLDILSRDLPSNLYGQFKFEFPHKCTLPGTLWITARSKMVLRTSPAGLLAYIIALDGVGLLPTLARIWDLVPFSFVVDWFTSLSDRFSDVDHAAIRAALDVDYYLHTFEYKLLLDESSYTPLHRGRTDPPMLRMYIRERSRRHPLFQESKYDFHPPAMLNKHLLASGALLWAT